MRTTLSLDEDVLQRARAVAGQRHVPLKTIINQALRAGLTEVEKRAKQRPYKTVGHDMGLRPGLSLENVPQLLAQLEGEAFR
jgi:hypothetical protein